jgi:hypothetical protein
VKLEARPGPAAAERPSGPAAFRARADAVLHAVAAVPLAAGDGGGLDVFYIRSLVANKWRLYRTIELNVAPVEALLTSLGDSSVAPAVESLCEPFETLGSAPKSTRWKLPASVGDRVRRYEQPEEALRAAATTEDA